MAILLRMVFCLGLFMAQAAWASLEDPTRPAMEQEGSSASAVPVWGLQAIIISQDQRSAIFNGQTLHLGSLLAGFKVVAITRNAVHLAGPNGKMILFLFNQTVKKAVINE